MVFLIASRHNPRTLCLAICEPRWRILGAKIGEKMAMPEWPLELECSEKFLGSHWTELGKVRWVAPLVLCHKSLDKQVMLAWVSYLGSQERFSAKVSSIARSHLELEVTQEGIESSRMSKTKWETLNDAGGHPSKELMLGLLDHGCPFTNGV